MRSSPRHRLWLSVFFALLIAASVTAPVAAQNSIPREWERQFPLTDWSRSSVDIGAIQSGGPPRDGIPSIDDPRFAPVATVEGLADNAPVMSLEVEGVARAYPISILIWHEIVNDVIAGQPVAVTYCPLCNSGVVFDRTVDGQVLEFGTTGKLRNSDLIMYDRQTETWWQQFTGVGIIGDLVNVDLGRIPVRHEAFGRFAARNPDGEVLVPTDPRLRSYGRNPYIGYDTSTRPFLYRGDYTGPGSALMRVVSVEDEAWSMALIRREGEILAGDLILRWEAGKASALDAPLVDQGREIGNVEVVRRTATGEELVVFDIPFAFAFNAFHPDGVIHHTR